MEVSVAGRGVNSLHEDVELGVVAIGMESLVCWRGYRKP